MAEEKKTINAYEKSQSLTPGKNIAPLTLVAADFVKSPFGVQSLVPLPLCLLFSSQRPEAILKDLKTSQTVIGPW